MACGVIRRTVHMHVRSTVMCGYSIVANVHRHDIESVAHERRSRDVRTVVGLVHHALYTTKGGWGVPYRTFVVLRTTVWSVEATCPGLMPGLYLTVEREHPI